MAVDDAERVRRRALLKAHLEAENAGDVDAVLATFATGAVMHHNTIAFPSADAIRSAHQYIGFARGEGAFAEARNVVDRESFTDTDIVIEGRMCGRHEREFMGFKPAGRAVEMPFVAFYQFDARGKLACERVVMNLGPLQSAT